MDESGGQHMSQPSEHLTCLFCKIVHGSIPSVKVLETDHALAFLDINPVNKGHVLLVPKAHHADLASLPEDLAAETARLVPKLARAIQAATGADGLNLIVNNGEAAGQTVFHGHWHLIPRFVDDPVNWPWPHEEYSGDELNQMRFRIERELINR
jgi:histidine triad (HIT) family protein